MNKTKIEWTRDPSGSPGYTWNPIKGLCPVGCWYCYARKIYKRFDIMGVNTMVSQQNKLILAKEEMRIFDKGLRRADTGPRKPSKIFVCSTIEIFHKAIPKTWRDEIFKIIKSRPEHTFIILTKLPQNIDRPMPDNVWLGVSVTNQEDADKRIPILLQAEAKVRFVSTEPMLGPVSLGGSLFTVEFGPAHFDGKLLHGGCAYFIPTKQLSWIIIGRLTGHGKRHDPKLEWLQDIVRVSREAGLPIFLKNNLSGIWPGKLIQEWPEAGGMM